MSTKRKLVWIIVFVVLFVIVKLFNGNVDNTIKQNNQAISENDKVVLKPFVKSDFYWAKSDVTASKNKELLVEHINLIRNTIPDCRNIEPDVFTSQSKGTKSNPVFFVTCEKEGEPYNVFFSKSEAESNTSPKIPKALDETTAVQKCIDEIKRNANHPESIDSHYLLGKAYIAHPNGNATVMLTFGVKNSFETEIDCLVQPNGETDISFVNN